MYKALFTLTKFCRLSIPSPVFKTPTLADMCLFMQASLKRLQLDYVDLIFCHRPDPNTPMEGVIGDVAADQSTDQC